MFLELVRFLIPRPTTRMQHRSRARLSGLLLRRLSSCELFCLGLIGSAPLRLRNRLLRHSGGLLQQGLHEPGVANDLATVSHLGQGLLVASELLQDPLMKFRQAEVLADLQALHNVAGREVLGNPLRRPLREPRQSEVLGQEQDVLDDVLRLRPELFQDRVVHLVDEVEHELHSLGVGDVGQPHLLLLHRLALACGRLRAGSQALPEDLALRGQDHAVGGEDLVGADQRHVGELRLPVKLPQATA
mmetsp:Transcript_86758/g.194169  ORF Transcript_86758/g.194169 Transcript_86758/m.194169 type:complete len:245 (+) Transcript_86758:10-744(+)